MLRGKNSSSASWPFVMSNFRIIPVVLISGSDVVKGVKFKERKYVGDPINTVKIFNDKYVDELCVLDVHASKGGHSPNFTLLREIASQAFMPLSYGGGLHNFSDVKGIFNAGFEKCILNSCNYNNLGLIEETATTFGSQSVACSVDFRRSSVSKSPVLYSMSGSTKHKFSILDFCLRLQDSGAGEIIVSAIDKDGTRSGLDIEIYREIRERLTIPLVASGGASSLEDILNLKNEVNISAVAVGDLFTFYGKRKSVLINYPKYSELRKLFG